MTEIPDARARRPWWKTKRWAAALALWIVVAYLLSLGPAWYALHRGWISPHAADLYAAPASLPMRLLESYVDWWADLGSRHAASD